MPAPKSALCRPQTCYTKTGFARMLNLPHQDRLCADPKPAFLFWIHILTVSEAMCDCQGLGIVVRIDASNLVFDTMQVLYWPVLRQIQFCSFDRRCKTCLDTKPFLYQDMFCSLTDVTLDEPVTWIHKEMIPEGRSTTRACEYFIACAIPKYTHGSCRISWIFETGGVFVRQTVVFVR